MAASNETTGRSYEPQEVLVLRLYNDYIKLMDQNIPVEQNVEKLLLDFNSLDNWRKIHQAKPIRKDTTAITKLVNAARNGRVKKHLRDQVEIYLDKAGFPNELILMYREKSYAEAETVARRKGNRK